MANIFSLFGTIFIDNEKANKGIDETTKKGENAGSKVGNAFGKIAKTALAVGTAVVGTATVLGTAAMSVVTKVADTASAIDDSSKKVGTTAEEYQKWAYAAKLSGMEMSTLDRAMIKQQKSFSDAKDGSKSMSEAYNRLGLDINQFSNSGQAFDAVIARLADMEDETTRNALANDIFGKSYAELGPLLAEGSGGIEKMRNEAVKLGGVMSNEAVSAGEQFGDTLDKIKTVGAGLFNQLGSSLMPIFQKLSDLLLANVPMIQGAIEQILPVIVTMFEQLLPPLLDLAQMLFPILLDLIMQILPPVIEIMSAILPVIIQLLTMLLPPILQIVQQILPLLLSLIQPLLPLLQPILALLQPFIDLLMALLVPLIQLINMILPPIISLFTTLITAILPPLKAAFELVAKVITSVFKGAFEGIKPIIDAVVGIFKGIIDFITGIFTGNWEQAWNGIVGIFKGIFDGIFAIFKWPINLIIDGINFFIRALNLIKIPDWVPLIGGFGFNIAEIKRLRIGMEYVPYDDMPALLHKGERVLTASEAKEYSSGGGGSGLVINIYNPNFTSEKETDRTMNKVVTRLRAVGVRP